MTMHRLQQVFATAEGEQQFEDQLHTLFAVSDFAAAEKLLAAELETMDSPVAALCRELGPETCEVTGFEDLLDSLDGLEGEPVSTLVIVAANMVDLAFEKGKTHDPFLSAMIYTDEGYAFSSTPAADLIAECHGEEGPAWAGKEEDFELYLEIDGFGPLNTALLFHKQRHFFRDDAPDQAPLRYVEYVLGCWWRALRCQQAIAAAFERDLSGAGLRAVVSLEDMRPEFVSVIQEGKAAQAVERRPVFEAPSLVPDDFIQRKEVVEEQEVSGSDLRRKISENADNEGEVSQPRGFFARLFGRGTKRDKAA